MLFEKKIVMENMLIIDIVERMFVDGIVVTIYILAFFYSKPLFLRGPFIL